MNITLVGYGSLNQLIDGLADSLGHTIVAKISPSLGTTLSDIPSETDVIIDCSTPGAIMTNITYYASHGLRAVIGTTGWYEHLDEVKHLFQNSSGALLWASNFALGVHTYLDMIAHAATRINCLPEFDIFARELHHAGKKDSPSGTVISVAEKLLQNIDRKTTLVTEELHRQILPHELHVSSTRGGFANFSHEVYFDSPDETITITHSAKNRTIYARGALQAAEWLLGKHGYFTMDEWVDEVLQGSVSA